MITLKTLPEASAQQVFDQAAVHMLTQKRKSMITEDTCAYRGGEQKNLMCAAGCLIGDDEYRPEWDYDGGKRWEELVAVEYAPEDHALLITELQEIHDASEPETWLEHLTSLAKQNSLNTDAIKNVVQP